MHVRHAFNILVPTGLRAKGMTNPNFQDHPPYVAIFETIRIDKGRGDIVER